MRNYECFQPSLTQVPELNNELLEPVNDLLNGMPETSQEKAQFLIDRIESLTLRQKVRLLLELDPQDYEEFKKLHQDYQAAALAGIDSGMTPIDSIESTIRNRSLLLTTIPRYIVEVDIRKRAINLGSGYPAYFDDDLIDSDPRFKVGDGLPRLRQGERISYEEAIEYGREKEMLAFVQSRLNPLVSRSENPLPLDADTIGREFWNFVYNLPEPLKNVITLGDLRIGLNAMIDRFSGNVEIEKTCNQAKIVLNQMLEDDKNSKKLSGNTKSGNE